MNTSVPDDDRNPSIAASSSQNSAAGEAADAPSTAGDSTYVVTQPGRSGTVDPTAPYVPKPQAFSLPTDQIGDYELLAEIARGGMGVVYKARHVRLGSLAAVKLIKSGEFASQKEIHRFLTEARAAAQLSHPGIVSVHQVGEHASQHFLAMAYVDGQSLWQCVKESPLEPKLAAKLMQQVAEAIQYAHDKGIIHRDLKPQNILLETSHQTASGPQPSILDPQPKVTDFGLAKNQAGDSSLTASGDVLGTPSYMPPEQATGKLAQVGPLADVYSLGATLYCLLTGRPPFQAANSLETLLQVVEQEPVPPRQLNRSVPVDLETICLKCLEKDSAKRYASAKALADDLGRFQRDEPILARPVSRAEHAWRWCRRNPMVAALSTSAIVLLVAVTTVSTLAYFREAELVSEKDGLIQDKDRLIGEKDDLVKKAQAAEAIANDERRQAIENADVARDQSQLALTTLNSVIFDLQRSLKKLPGGAAVRQRLLTTAFEKLEQVSTEFVKQASVDRNSAVALLEMADTILQVGAADTQTRAPDESSSVGTAMKLYSGAQEIFQKLVAADPDDGQAQRALAVSYSKLGDVQLLLAGQVTEARESYQQSLEIAHRRAAANPDDSEAQRDLAISYGKLGNVQLQSGQVAETRRSHQQSLEIFQRRATADPDDSEAQRDLAISYERLGDVHLQSGAVAEALRSYQQSLEISQRRAAADPDDSQTQSDLARSNSKVGDVQLQSGQVAESLASYQQSLEIRERCATADPDDSQTQRDLAVSYSKLGDVQLHSGQAAEALRSYQQSLEIDQRRATADPDDSQAQRDLAVSYEKLGDVQLQSGQVAEAIQSYQQSLEIRQRRATADPDDSRAQRDLFVSYYQLGEAAVRARAFDAAAAQFQTGIAVLDQMIEKGQAVDQSKRERQLAQQRLAISIQAKLALGNWEELLLVDPEQLPALLLLRATELQTDGDLPGILQAADKLRELDPQNKDNLYNAACLYARCAAAVAKDKPDPTSDELAEQKKYLDQSLAALKESLAAGWEDFDHLQKDPDLEPLRELPEFKTLLDEAMKAGK